MKGVRVVTVPGDPEREADLAPRLAAAGMEVLLRCMDRVELLGALRGGGIDAVVAVGAPSWVDVQVAEEVGRAGVRLVGVVSDPLDADRLAALGATLLPADATVAEIGERCTSEAVVPPPPPPPDSRVPAGRLVAVWGPKGAPGRTTIAVEIAALFAAEEPGTLLLDGDTYGGDVVQVLGIVEELPTILWAARLAARRELDAAGLSLALRRAGNGPVVLPGIPRPQLWADIGEFAWRALLDVVRDTFRVVVCDVGFSLERNAVAGATADPGRNRVTLETLDAADHVVAVCRADPVGIKSFLWAYDDLRDVVLDERIIVVANRVPAGREGDVGETIKRYTGRRPAAYVPDRRDELRRAAVLGDSVHATVPGSDVSAALRGVVAALGGRTRPRGLLSRLAGSR